jgi:phospholipid/cholesterol/gamma-HCH transport system substrate-binding protein
LKLSKEFVIGIIAIVTIAVFFLGFNYLKQNDVFNKERVFYAIYENVDGLVPDRAVTINGFQVGRVKDIYFHPDATGELVVKFVMNNDFQFSEKSVARIYSLDLLGTKAVEIDIKEGERILQSGDTLISATELSLTEEVNKQVAPIKAKAEQLMASLDTVMLYIRTVMDEETRDNIANIFENTKRTFETLDHTMSTLDRMVGENEEKIGNILSSMESISKNLEESGDTLTNILANVEMITDSLAKADLYSTVENLNSAIMQMDTIITKINNGEGSMGLLVNDDELYRNLTEASSELEHLLEDLKLNPSRYVRFSVFGGNKPYEEPTPEENKK